MAHFFGFLPQTTTISTELIHFHAIQFQFMFNAVVIGISVYLNKYTVWVNVLDILFTFDQSRVHMHHIY